jgi:hypothetical protein
MALNSFDINDFIAHMGESLGIKKRPNQALLPGHTQVIHPSAYLEKNEVLPTDQQDWYKQTPHDPMGPAVGLQDEPENDQLASFLSEGREGLQGPALSDIQVSQAPRRIQMPPMEVHPHGGYSLEVGEPQLGPQYDVQVGPPQIEPPAIAALRRRR